MTPSRITLNASESLAGSGPDSQIVISSRVRLARNLEGKPFPDWAKKPERIILMEAIKAAVEALPEMTNAFSERLENLTILEKQVLVERHLISCEHAAKSVGSAVVMNAAQTLSFMINEEDHLRMQAIRSGLQLHETFAMIAQADRRLEEHLVFSFDAKIGYLTACPSNVGTGMRASVMMHLPALVLSEQINKIINSVNKMSLAVRGLHGEGTDAIGNLFQISNQTTLGKQEEEILEQLNTIIREILHHEQNARALLLEREPETLLDQAGRAHGILQNAYSISTKEALNLLSTVKLGIDLQLFPVLFRPVIDELLIETQPAHLQKGAQLTKISSKERDSLRARMIRTKLMEMPAPRL
ncbi:MAG: protein arginine kinase [Chthoniobacterales bacterium]